MVTVLKTQGSEGIYLTQIVKMVHTVTLWNDEDYAFDEQLDQWGVEFFLRIQMKQ